MPPPLGGGPCANPKDFSHRSGSRKFFGQKFRTCPGYGNCLCFMSEFFTQFREFMRQRKKPERTWKFLDFFGPKTKKNPFFGGFRPRARPRGPFKARKGVRSCSLTYSEEIDYLVADFGPIFFSRPFFPKKKSITSGSGFCPSGGLNLYGKKSENKKIFQNQF